MNTKEVFKDVFRFLGVGLALGVFVQGLIWVGVFKSHEQFIIANVFVIRAANPAWQNILSMMAAIYLIAGSVVLGMMLLGLILRRGILFLAGGILVLLCGLGLLIHAWFGYLPTLGSLLGHRVFFTCMALIFIPLGVVLIRAHFKKFQKK